MPRFAAFLIATLSIVSICAPAAASEAPAWQTSGKSAQGRPLQHLEIPGNADRVMIVSGFRGTRNASIQVADSLARFASEQGASPDTASLLIIRDANPDGRASRTANNARGVDVDRNFASSDWRKIPVGPHWLGGRQPVSEPETRWLVGLIDTWQPTRIVVFLGDGQQGWIRTLGPDQQWKDFLTTRTNLPWVESSLAVPSGSLASWTAFDRKIPTLLLNLPADDNAVEFWRSQQQLLTGIVTSTVVASDETVGMVAQTPRESHYKPSNLKPKRRLVDVAWPWEAEQSNLVQRTPPRQPFGHTVSSRTPLGSVSLQSIAVQPAEAKVDGGDKIYRFPPAEHIRPREAPTVDRQPEAALSTQYPTLPHRPIPIWVDPNGS